MLYGILLVRCVIVPTSPAAARLENATIQADSVLPQEIQGQAEPYSAGQGKSWAHAVT
jgi:hypothetical protein